MAVLVESIVGEGDVAWLKMAAIDETELYR